MGANCTCLKAFNAEDGQMNTIDRDDVYKGQRDSSNKFYTIEYIIQLQSIIRGHLERRCRRELSRTPLNSSPFLIANRENLQELTGPIPDYSNTATLASERKLGQFVYPSVPDDGILKVQKNAVKLENNAIYIGEWNTKNERHGKGLQMWNDGSKYEGYWKNDKANGRGRLIHGDGDVYEGDWVDDKAHGFGVYLHTDGARYEGSWVNDKQHGHGKEEWPDGSNYEGNYFNGQKHGEGKFVWSDGSTYEGKFSNNDIHGHGKYSWIDGRIYIGTWQSNKMHGKGEFTWPDGRKYTGEYVDDKKEGYGVFEWPDGKRYEGEWRNGKQHGKGVFTNGNEKIEGVWLEGKRKLPEKTSAPL
ncbi:hypothetical protein SteCoe_19289 [Stentor coeruleus]|uniref:MORN repeat protein n=1 Tax=Stentor coeruleus TaxID=5963 RepID=A0A1R2BUS1_9CILI|nr:hypothetical protein SteCoe_19289 [Stentor coeruleus]